MEGRVTNHNLACLYVVTVLLLASKEFFKQWSVICQLVWVDVLTVTSGLQWLFGILKVFGEREGHRCGKPCSTLHHVVFHHRHTFRSPHSVISRSFS